MAKIPASITRLLNLVRIDAPGVIDDALRAVFFDIVDEWMKTTNVWQECIPFDVEVNQLEYTLVPTGVAQINRLLGVVSDQKLPIAASMATPGCLMLSNPVTSIPSPPLVYTAIVANNVIDPPNSSNYPIFPQWIMDKYRIDFKEGILGMLMAQPGKPYSSSTMAVYHTRRFRNAMANCRGEVMKQNTYGAQNWAYPQQFQTRPRHGSGGEFGGPV
jgi:hypothetical protein